ncbi:MBL fold metallo-hydrolase [Mucilaginibacter hurinus]|uniref:MBL fold metallo-hydrolase n=1 Tax=Mucilaginibacter hurinus TaxID=2201324 RepID=A0A367GTL4_9SPHI|nr:MBL fold metallo-hydrolase [Mucilaginibacter hurinus]RCH56752.1 MBL fold metallo-hydrolase [Mucilaginibacter hurinus]
MAKVKSFVNNPLEQNTCILYDDSGECAIIDPGMYTGAEQNAVVDFITQHNLKPVLLLNTHCHLDHVLGNKFIFDQYGLKPKFHEGEEMVLSYAPVLAAQWGMQYDNSPLPEEYLPETGTIRFGITELTLIFAPGHSPAHLCFYDSADKILIGGDVLFRGSIGRSDLPGGNHNQLLQNIRQKLFVLPDECTVFPGHGPETTIGYEKKYNPFFNQ